MDFFRVVAGIEACPVGHLDLSINVFKAPRTQRVEGARILEKAEVQKALNDVRPQLQMDGGDVELVDIVDGVVKVKLKGHCAGCPMSQYTVKYGVEQYLKKKVPGVKAVESV
jgi:Fe-S cluster biogenesis protein NfuA